MNGCGDHGGPATAAIARVPAAVPSDCHNCQPASPEFEAMKSSASPATVNPTGARPSGHGPNTNTGRAPFSSARHNAVPSVSSLLEKYAVSPTVTNSLGGENSIPAAAPITPVPALVPSVCHSLMPGCSSSAMKNATWSPATN